jgi:signal transduction histidine kinase
VPTGLRAHTDRDRLRQVLMNLLGNAAKFTEAGSITVTANGEEERLRLSVRDTGPGIPAAQLAIIFEEFARLDEARSREGTGLGLAITRQLCHLLGGTVRATSVVGEGSTFTVEVPLAWRGRG